jgi:hypothetical protein
MAIFNLTNLTLNGGKKMGKIGLYMVVKIEAHMVILCELLHLIPESEKIEEKMKICRIQFGDDRPYQTEAIMLASQTLLCLKILRSALIPPEDKPEFIEKLELLKETPFDGYKAIIQNILDYL